FTASGASFFETAPPAEKKAMSIPEKLSGFASSTVISLLLNLIFLPADLLDDNSFISLIGNCLSCNRCIIFCPTAPVAPTNATLYVLLVTLKKSPPKIRIYNYRVTLAFYLNILYRHME